MESLQWIGIAALKNRQPVFLVRYTKHRFRQRRIMPVGRPPVQAVLVMDQVADDFIERLRRVRHQLSDLTDNSATLEHELLQCALECMFSYYSLHYYILHGSPLFTPALVPVIVGVN